MPESKRVAKEATPATYEERIRRVEEALRRLPLTGMGRATLAGNARHLAMMDGRAARFIYTAENSPNANLTHLELMNRTDCRTNQKPASRGATKKQLHNIKKCTFDLIVALDHAHEPAVDLLNLKADSYADLRRLLLHVLISADVADTSGLPEIAGRGQPKKERAAKIADETAWAYLFLTGAEPTVATPVGRGKKAYGPFLDLLSVIFAVTGASTPVEYQARQAIERMKAYLERKRALEAQLNPFV